MIEMGLSISQIAGALHIKKAVVAGILAETGKSNAGGNAGAISREGKKNVQSKETIKPKKEAGKTGGDGDPSPGKNIGEMPPDPGNAPEGSEGPTGNTQSNGIKFIGGKKNMANKKENDPGPEEFEYECPHCHHEFNERSDTCPSCGGSLSGYED
jgi:hypothetical protein